jgi:hypothetical protein
MSPGLGPGALANQLSIEGELDVRPPIAASCPADPSFGPRGKARG